MRTRAIIAIIVMYATAATASPASFQPPSRVAAAQTRFKHGTKLYDAGDYAGAAAEYAAAFALDDDAKWLLLDIAIAKRKAKACTEAMDAYSQFLAQNPPIDQADKAREGEAGCAQQLAQSQREHDEQAKREADQRASQARADAERTQRAAEAEQRRARDTTAASARARRVAIVFGATALGLGVVAGGVYGFARVEASDTRTASSTMDYESSRSNAFTLRDASWIVGGAAATVAAAGFAYYMWRGRAPTQTVGLAPTSSGVLLTIGGRL